MKLFECIIDDGTDVYKSLCTAKSKKELLDVYGGNGDFIKIKDITNEYFDETSAEELRNDLKKSRLGRRRNKIDCCPS